MANPTTNYGFVLPTATDLVTDLPADFDVALQGVDTRLKALQPGTTLGDLAYSSATANTNTRLGIGTSGQVLAVSGGVPAWTTPATSTSALTKIVTGTFTTSAGVAINGCFSSTYDNYVVLISKFKSQGNLEYMYVQFQYATSTVQTTNYYSGGYYMYANGTTGNLNVANGTKINLGQYTDVARGFATLNVSLNGYPSFHGSGNGGNSDGISIFGGEVDASNTYTGLKITGTGNISGVYTVYGLEK
jgi:hypothetical protein